MLFVALSEEQEKLKQHTCSFQMCRILHSRIQGTLFATFLHNNVQAAARKKCNFELYIHTVRAFALRHKNKTLRSSWTIWQTSNLRRLRLGEE